MGFLKKDEEKSYNLNIPNSKAVIEMYGRDYLNSYYEGNFSLKQIVNYYIELNNKNVSNNSNLFVHFLIKFDHFFCQNLEYFRTHHLVFCMCKDETHLRVFTGRFFLHQICTSSCPRNIPTSTIGTGISLVIDTVVNT